MQNHEESPFVQFIRAGILLLALVAVPGIAVCWNFLPKNYSIEQFFDDNKSEKPDNSKVYPLPKKMPITKVSENNNNEIPELPALPNDPFNSRFADQLSVSQSVVSTERIKPAAGDMNDGTAETNIPAAFVPSPAEWASTVASNVQVENIQTEEIQTSAAYSEPSPVLDAAQQSGISLLEPKTDYPALEKELNTLGVKYYRLEKWGRQGDLFRFSCYVSSNPEVTYQKYFQAIDSDEIRVMQRVVNEIKQWKSNIDVR